MRQRVVLNEQSSNWKNVRAGVPQGSVLGPLLFLIYINDLPWGLHVDIKLFADDTSLFSDVDNIDESAPKLNNDLIRIQEWAYQWKISFILTELNQLMKLYSLRKLKILFTLIFT